MKKHCLVCPVLRTAFKRTHLVDKCLLLFMGVLLIQSTIALFATPHVSNEINTIDIIIRTSTAAIFGYFLSANFIRNAPRGDSGAAKPPESQAISVSSPPSAPMPEPTPVYAAAQATVLPTQADTSLSASTMMPVQGVSSVPDEIETEGRLQIIVATVIGLFCLLMLIMFRHALEKNINAVFSPTATAIVAQFRDFVSSCVGFLIGCPTEMRNRS